MRAINYREGKVEIELKPIPEHKKDEVFIQNIEEFDAANIKHVEYVKKVLEILAYCLIDAGVDHDYTKLREPYRTIMYLDKYNSIIQDMEFSESGWMESHKSKERYHIEGKDDVDLLDVIEMICNKVVKGKEESNEEKIKVDFEDSELLLKAFQNTVNLINEVTTRKNDEENLNLEAIPE